MHLHLIPAPRVLKPRPGHFFLSGETFVLLPGAGREVGGPGLFGAEQFVRQVVRLSGVQLPLVVVHVAQGLPADALRGIRVVLGEQLAPELAPEVREQAYRLTISPDGIELAAAAEAGLYYGFQTLLQIVREVAWREATAPRSHRKFKTKVQKSVALPCLEIFDYPDVARRGVYHDTARGKVPKVETLLQLIDDLAHLKYNEFQLYIENNFQFRKHPDMYDDTDPLTAEELQRLDVACKQRHMDFVPSLTSLGHFEKILCRPKYRALAEAEPAQLKALGAPCWFEEGPWSLCVTDPRARKLLREMYDEFAPNFTSGQFNICCDEAYDLGRVRSKKRADKIGIGQMYVDWINYCDRLVKAQGKHKAIQMWGDIILQHPELIGQLPADATLLEWGYEHDHKFEEHCALFAKRLRGGAKRASRNATRSGRSFYVAPGTSSWLTLSARTKNACGNIHAAARAGLTHGARGILVTDWGDQGHQQMLAVSLVPFAYGAAAGWNLDATPNPYGAGNEEARKSKIKNQQSQMPDLLRAISLHLFMDPTAQFASAAYDLGLTYERLGWQRFNASLDHFLFREKWDFANYVNRAPADALKRTLATTKDLRRRFGTARLLRADGELICDEFVLTCEEIMHTCVRTQLRQRWLEADPAVRNPEENELRVRRPVALPAGYRAAMQAARREVGELAREFERMWLARNKRSRLADVRAEFGRLEKEYREFAG